MEAVRSLILFLKFIRWPVYTLKNLERKLRCPIIFSVKGEDETAVWYFKVRNCPRYSIMFFSFLLYSLCSLFSMEGAAAMVGYSELDHQSAQELGKLTIKILNLLII